jgi:hypothetical protein
LASERTPLNHFFDLIDGSWRTNKSCSSRIPIRKEGFFILTCQRRLESIDDSFCCGGSCVDNSPIAHATIAAIFAVNPIPQPVSYMLVLMIGPLFASTIHLM